jgi:hypothetical protein
MPAPPRTNCEPPVTRGTPAAPAVETAATDPETVVDLETTGNPVVDAAVAPVAVVACAPWAEVDVHVVSLAVNTTC